MGFFGKIVKGLKNATGIDVANPGNNFTTSSMASQINPLKKFSQTEYKLSQAGQAIGLNKAGKVKQGFPYGRPPETPLESSADQELDQARFLEERARGRAATLLSDETDPEQGDDSVTRRRLRGV